MATTPTTTAMTLNAAAAAAAAAAAGATTPTSKNTPHLHSVASSLRSCLDGMLPDALRNDAGALQLHMQQQQSRLQTEKNSWRFGLNYLFETLKQHKDWYARNQQFVQLRKDVRRFEAHVATLRSILSESVSKLDLEAGLRVAELEGRVGAYKIMFEVTKIVTKLSRPLVKLQILKPSESSLSIYCDTFVLDIVLAGGEGAVESASLMTVEKDVSKQFPERDEDLLRALKQLAAGESSNFSDKLVRLINRAELAVKYPTLNFEQMEEDIYVKLSAAAAQHPFWTVRRSVDGIGIHFKDALNCAPVVEPPRKRMKVEDPSAPTPDGLPDAAAAAAAAAAAGAGAGGTGGEPKSTEEGGVPTAEGETTNPLAHGEWSGNVSFIEWRGEVALHVVGYTPLVMVGVQARRLALAVMRKPTDLPAEGSVQEDEKQFNDFVSWVAASPPGEEHARKPIAPQLHFARDHSVCSVWPPQSSLPMRQEYSLVTKEISGGLQLHAFPIPFAHATATTLASVFQICGHSLFFHSVLLSAFCSRNNAFGRRLTPEIEDVMNVPFKVDVSAPEHITLKTETLPTIDKQLLIEFGTKADGQMTMAIKAFDGTVKNETVGDGAVLEGSEATQKLTKACHSVPLVTYYALQRVLQRHSAKSAAGGATAQATSTESGEDCDGIVTLDDEMAVPMKLEGGEDMMLDDMGMY